MYTVVQIKPEECYSVWKDVRGLLEPAIERSGGRWRNEYVFAALITRRQSLWVIMQKADIIAAFTTEIIAYPEKRMTAIHFFGGDGFDKWYQDMLDAVVEYSKLCGCDGIEFVARFGFWKWIKRDGFERKSVFYEKEI